MERQLQPLGGIAQENLYKGIANDEAYRADFAGAAKKMNETLARDLGIQKNKYVSDLTYMARLKPKEYLAKKQEDANRIEDNVLKVARTIAESYLLVGEPVEVATRNAGQVAKVVRSELQRAFKEIHGLVSGSIENKVDTKVADL